MSPQKSSSPASIPPIVDSRLPPSPPASPKRRSPPGLSTVNRILGILRLLQAGRLPNPRKDRSFRLSELGVETLHERIAADPTLAAFYDQKVRWADQDGTYFLRMPSVVHEVFTARVVDGVAEAISALATRLGGTAGDALRGIKKGGSPTLKLSGPAPPSSSSQESGSQEKEVLVETHRSPDGTFFHESAPEWPGVVVEVSYSQQNHKLDRIAESYIVDSFGGIRCVVGLELPYERDPRVRSCIMGMDCTAALSIWRPHVEKDEDDLGTLSCVCEVEHVPFIGRTGKRVEGQLELGMADLLPREVLDTLDEEVRSERCIIPFADLWKYLRDANNADRAMEESKASQPTKMKGKMKRRKRKRTPEEEMDQEREEKFQRLEDVEVEREQRQDSAWRGSRSGSSARAREPERRSARLSLRSGAVDSEAKVEPS